MLSGENVRLTDTRSLSDFDVVLFAPNFALNARQLYQGQPSLDLNESAQLHSQQAHWKLELETAAKLNKTILVLMSAPAPYYYSTGQRRVEGSGKTARAVNLVSQGDSYGMLREMPVNPTAVTGRILRSASPLASRFPKLCKFFQELEHYEAVTTSAQSPLLVLPDGSGRCAAYLCANYPNVVAVPMILSQEAWVEDKLDKNGVPTRRWTKAANEFARQLADVIEEAHAQVQEGRGEAKPAWVLSGEFKSVAERERDSKLDSLVKRRDRIESDIAACLAAEAEEQRWLDLLYAGGTLLEARVREALGLLGVEATEYHDETHQFDVVFTIEQTKFIGECEGKDNKSIDISKLSQLERCVAEDVALNDSSEFPVGVLFGNSHRLHPLEDRGAVFTDRVVKAAEQRGVKLVSTVDLFRWTLALRNGDSGTLGAAFRRSLLEPGGGLVRAE